MNDGPVHCVTVVVPRSFAAICGEPNPLRAVYLTTPGPIPPGVSCLACRNTIALLPMRKAATAIRMLANEFDGNIAAALQMLAEAFDEWGGGAESAPPGEDSQS